MPSRPNPLDVITNKDFVEACRLLDLSDTKVRWQIEQPLKVLGTLGYELVRLNELGEPQVRERIVTRHVATLNADQEAAVFRSVETVLGDVADMRDLGVDVSYEEEIAAIVDAMKEALGGCGG